MPVPGWPRSHTLPPPPLSPSGPPALPCPGSGQGTRGPRPRGSSHQAEAPPATMSVGSKCHLPVSYEPAGNTNVAWLVWASVGGGV